ncbi:MAG TPA: nucleoside transporter C-terminal domain-containing protein [Polyangiaceae bacterium]
MPERIVSALGVVVMLGLAFAACPRERRRHVNLRTLGGGLLLLLVAALLVLRTPVRGLFSLANRGVERLLGFSAEGARFVFGKLVDAQGFGFVFAFQVLPTILFFSALMAVLYHLRVMPFLIHRFGRLLSGTLRVSGAESFSTAADVFVGQTEAPLVVRPYLARMTLSELHACMVAGFATTAGGVLAAYVMMLSASVPGIAGHLIACSVMSAPASLLIAKLMLPETEPFETTGESRIELPARSTNLLDALATGTTDGVRLAVNVGAMLLVFLAFTALANAALGAAGEHLLGIDLSLERVLGWLFWPLAWVMGVPAGDVSKLASLLGQKTVLNEFVAYGQMSERLARDPDWLSERGRLIASYALCGFANFGSIGVQIGGYSGLAPERRADFSRLALRAMFGGLLTTNLVACVAGVLL